MFNVEDSFCAGFTVQQQDFFMDSQSPSPSPFFPNAPLMGSPFGAPMAQSPFVFPTPQSFPSTFPMTTQEDTHTFSVSHGDHHENSKVSTMNLKDRKQRLIERCQKQVKVHRSSVLQRFREGTLTPKDIQSNLHQLISTEQDNMSVDGFNKLERLEELEGEEYREIMTFLEEALFEGLRQEEKQLLDEYYEEIRKCEEEMEKEDQEAIQHALEASFDDGRSFVICPVCKKNRLLENHHIIFCACGMRVDTKQDDVDLTYLRVRLCELFQIHNSKCTGELQFSCSKECFGVPSMLFMNCNQCLCNEIVL